MDKLHNITLVDFKLGIGWAQVEYKIGSKSMRQCISLLLRLGLGIELEIGLRIGLGIVLSIGLELRIGLIIVFLLVQCPHQKRCYRCSVKCGQLHN